ncbi:MAG: BatA domain-containing protein [Bryobacteraceae bacterium]
MGFLSPLFLSGLVLLGLPLWLHLLRQYRRNPQPFSSVMFFERRLQSSTKHRRLRYIALLILRLALLSLLLLTFANPFVNRTSATAGKRKLTVFAVDRSFSMRTASEMDEAKREAARVLRGLGGGDIGQVLAVDSHIESLAGPEPNHAALDAAIQTIQPTDETSSFGELTRALRVQAQTTGMRLDVHLFSDMQQTSMPANFKDLTLGPDVRLQIHPVGSSSAPNWAVESVVTSPHVYDVKQTRLTATVAGWQTGEATRKISLSLDGKPLGTKTVTVPPAGRAQAEFLAFDVPYGPHRGKVSIEPHDSLPNDDEFNFSVERSDPRRVLFLYAAGNAREAFYYKAAIDSAVDTGLIAEPFPLEQAAGKDFSKYAFVILNDAGGLNDKTAQDLCGYVQHGGAALIVLGPSTARSGRVPLSASRTADNRTVQGVSFVDSQHSALAGAGRFENVQFFQSNRITPKPDAHVLARLADGTPLLVEERMGEGRTLTFTSTIDNSTSDFPLHASFLPFVAQTARYLSGKEEGPSSVVAGTSVPLRQTRNEGTAADVIGPGGKHELSLAESTKAFAFDLKREGFYEIQRSGAQRQLVAVHADRRESDLRKVPNDTLELWRNTGSAAVEAKAGAPASETRPFSLWRYLMVLVVVAALVESVFGSRYLKEGGQAA